MSSIENISIRSSKCVGFITETNQVVPTSQYDYDPQLFPMKTKSGADIPKKEA